MTADFDVIIVGSGPSGVSAAFPLVEAGLRVLIVDGGRQRQKAAPDDFEYLSARVTDPEQWKWMIGNNFYSLRMRDAVAPKLRVPSEEFVFEDFNDINQIRGTGFVTIGSLATGGLSNAWGCGVARFTASEMANFPFSAAEFEPYYASVCRRIGISGGAGDDLSDYLGLDEYSQPPLTLDAPHSRLMRCYQQRRASLNQQGFRLGRSRVAALSMDMPARQACNYSGNCLWGCRRHSLYCAADELPVLNRHQHFKHLPGFIVENLAKHDGLWRVEGKNPSGEVGAFSAKKIVLAAGALASTRLALKALNFESAVPVLSSPTAAFVLWQPSLLGEPRINGFGLWQLSFTISLRDKFTAFGSTLATTSFPVADFARNIPLRRRYAIDIMNTLLSSCVVGYFLLPGQLTVAKAKLKKDGSLAVSGKYADEVGPLMNETSIKLRKAAWGLGAMVLPGSFTVGPPGADLHYAGMLPMRKTPVVGETSSHGEITGLEGVYAVDGSCLPTLPEKLHTLTLMANATRIASFVAQDVVRQHNN